jgi:hypothetical protein
VAAAAPLPAGAPQPVAAGAPGVAPVAAAGSSVAAPLADEGLPTQPVSEQQKTADKSVTIASTAFFLQGEVLDMQWVGEDKSFVLLLTEEAILREF